MRRVHNDALASRAGAIAAAALGSLAACAAAPLDNELRILVTLTAPRTDGAAIARDASAAAATPVRYLASVSPIRHALAVACTDLPACELALQRLRVDSARFASVESDGRRARH